MGVFVAGVPSSLVPSPPSPAFLLPFPLPVYACYAGVICMHIRELCNLLYKGGKGGGSAKMCFTKGRVRRIGTCPPSICTSPSSPL